MILSVASGKGGTGKTTFAVNLAYVLAEQGQDVRLLDCDVEEPNDHLFVKPRFTEERAVTVAKPVWDERTCTACGRCAQACNYHAIAVVRKKVLVFNELCHACGVCSTVCPTGALREEPKAIGRLQVAPENQPFFFAHGLLNIGEALAPNVVKAVKTCIRPESVNILDASPGTACPVVEALAGADVAVLLTEPTPFGLNDLKLAAAMSLEMGIPTGIVVNRSDGADTLIARYAEAAGIPVIGRIPFRRRYAQTYSGGEILVHRHAELRDNLLEMYARILALRGAAVPAAPRIEELPVSPDGREPLPAGNGSGWQELTVISGKGGTGKTTVAAAFAKLARPAVLADNDVDAADLHLLLTPRVRESHPFLGGRKAAIDPQACTQCGACARACHFGAIRAAAPSADGQPGGYRIDPFACEGCGLCALVCPADAIRTSAAVTGRWYVSATDCGPMAHARLGIAEENSGRLVTQVRSSAAALADECHLERILGDGPPGTGCPVIASVSGVDLVVVVTEPTVSGVHDMERALALAVHFGVPAVVILNKADLNAEQAARVERVAQERASRVIARIPFDPAVNDALMAGKTIVEYGRSAAATAVRAAWKALQAALAETPCGKGGQRE